VTARVRVRVHVLLACAAATAACRPRETPAVLFDCRVSNASAQSAAGAPRAGVASSTFTSASQFLQLESGKRYLFVVGRSREFLVSLQTKEPTWFDHAALARGEPVLTAGGVTTIHDGRAVQKVVLDPQSAVYCPTTESLREAVALVVATGIPDARVRVEHRTFSCIDSGPAAAPAPDVAGSRDYGDVMVEIDRRFQLAGAAIARKDADTADYYLYALLRSIGEDLPRARPPESRSQQGLDRFVQTFIRNDFPPLRQAVWDEDWARAGVAFTAAAATCNACHEAANVGFLVVRSPFARAPRR